MAQSHTDNIQDAIEYLEAAYEAQEKKKEEKSMNQVRMDEKFALREKLNSVSFAFCPAKWLQSTIYLYNGYSHSCHHPAPHKVAGSEVQKNPKALHNTPIKIVARSEMLKGIQTKECGYCWNIENAGDHLSDRTYKAASPWAVNNIEEVIASGNGEDINPTYLEVAFDYTCNFKCTYCSPAVSSKWMEEIKQHGPYQLSKNTLNDVTWLASVGKTPIHKDEYNPYVEAFWKWWPELVKSLKVFRITGGEPLLSKHTWKVFDYLIENPNPELDIAINTNLGVPKKLIDMLVNYVNKLKGKVKSFEIYTSCEATGKAAEYIRDGMEYDAFIENCRYVLQNTERTMKLNFMVTTNILSSTTFTAFLKTIFDLRVEFNEDDALNRVPMMIAYLRWPPHLNLRLLPLHLKAQYAIEWREFVAAHTRQTSPNRAGRFYLEEIDQIERLIDFMNAIEPDEAHQRRDFYLYHVEYDRRRSLSFSDTFPELVPFMHHCKILAEN